MKIAINKNVIKFELQNWLKRNNNNSESLSYTSIRNAKTNKIFPFSTETIYKYFDNIKWNEILKECGFYIIKNNNKYNKSELVNILKNLNKQNISINEIDKNINVPSSSTFKRYFGSWSNALKCAGLNTGIITGRPQDEEIIINDKVLEIINGELLGDGCLSLSGSYKTNANFQHSTANIYYGKYVYNKLKNENVPLLNPEILPSRNNNNPQFRTRTTTNICWTKLYNKWYVNKEKIVPEDIILTPLTCLHWYLGDGSHSKNAGLTIYTCGFKKKYVELLAEKLSDFKAYCKSNKTYYNIYILKKYKDVFFKYIGDCPVKGYKHKW